MRKLSAVVLALSVCFASPPQAECAKRSEGEL
jgi:hypothetical protein